MKKYKLSIKKLAFLLLLLPACESEILDKTPMDRYSETVVWSDIKLADLFLQGIYRNISIGYENETTLSGMTDDAHNRTGRNTENYINGAISSSGNHPWSITTGFSLVFLGWNNIFSVINQINIFLANIDKVPLSYSGVEKTKVEEQANVLKGEALFMRAFYYTNLARTYGGVPLFNKPNLQTDDLLSIQRASFKETVEFISNDCDAAAALLLPKGQMTMGRADIGAALAVKSRIWLFAASDLTADGTAASKYVGYESPNRTELWTNAKNAAKAVIDLGTYHLEDWGTNGNAIADGYNDLFRAKTLASSEIIWGKMYLIPNLPHRMNQENGPNGQMCFGINGPIQNLIDAYQMEDGSDFFDHFKLDENNNYINISSKYKNENPYHNRDPRFYGTILFDSALFQPRLESLKARDPLGIYERRDRIFIENGKEVTIIPAIDGRQGPIYPTEATWTGYCMKKFLDKGVVAVLQLNYQENVFIELRYADVILSYAEACLRLSETAEATKYINMIRNRANLPDFTGDVTKALRYERRIEFALEDGRFYDIRRWKILDEAMVNAKGIDIKETHNKDDGTVKTTWKQTNIQNRGPVQQKMYWIPIPMDELKKAPLLVQNPGY